MDNVCSCGCEAIPHPYTKHLQVVLDRLGFTVKNTKSCEQRFDVIAMIDEITEEEVQRLLTGVKGINFKYDIFDEITKFRVHCIVIT